jgi:hypothetical protein
MKLEIIAFVNSKYPINEGLKTQAEQEQVPLHELNLGEHSLSDKEKCLALMAYFKTEKSDPGTALLITDGFSTKTSGTLSQIAVEFSQFESNIVFSADNGFDFPEDVLQYYYWKFYPRYSKYHNYLNSGLFIGKAAAVKTMVSEITEAYHLTSASDHPEHPYFTRYYVDCFLDIFQPSFPVKLDHDQRLLSSNRGNLSAARWSYINWVQDHLFQINEHASLKGAGQVRLRNLSYDRKKDSFKHKLTGKSPKIIHLPVELYEQSELADKTSVSGSNFLPSFWAYTKSIGQSLLVFLINRFSIDPKRTFRFEKHKNPDYETIMQQFLSNLEKGEAFTFAHFNDGELNFIRKYLKGDHKKTWNGRIQDQYDIPLAERLLDSIRYKQKNYYLGISCGTCGGPRKKVADDLIGDYDHKIGAMVFHHNLRYLPQIIGHMVNKEVFFVGNDYQKYDFLEHLGVTVKEENIMRIPFVNSHKVYDELTGKKFPEGSMVILTCGMLAKILIRNWYEINPNVTFLALGSTMDDFIQTSNTNYRPYPRKLPLTRNVHLIKAFLFGNKKQCVECYNF